MKKIAQLLIVFYRKCISPHFSPRCRYIPSCSSYAYEALEVHGFFIGSTLALWRIFRCHPFCAGGADSVPPKGFYKKGLW